MRAMLSMFVCDDRFLRALAGVAMGGCKEQKKEWNHFQDNPLNLEGKENWGIEWGIVVRGRGGYRK